MICQRRTIRSDATLEGLGLHSGEPVRVVVHPAEDGIHFRSGQGRWKASPENVSDTTRCTRLGDISTIEHLMSALAGLEITDAEIEVFGNEMPALGGSSFAYVEGLSDSGFRELGPFQVPEIFKRIFLQEDEIKIAVGKGTGHWRYGYEVPGRWPGLQAYETADVVSDYREQISPARTFALEEEVPAILQMGLAKGLDVETALILGNEGYTNAALFDDEPARHKLLDLIGDLYLAGVPIRLLNVAADRSGHRTNVKAAKLLREHLVLP